MLKSRLIAPGRLTQRKSAWFAVRAARGDSRYNEVHAYVKPGQSEAYQDRIWVAGLVGLGKDCWIAKVKNRKGEIKDRLLKTCVTQDFTKTKRKSVDPWPNYYP